MAALVRCDHAGRPGCLKYNSICEHRKWHEPTVDCKNDIPGECIRHSNHGTKTVYKNVVCKKREKKCTLK